MPAAVKRRPAPELPPNLRVYQWHGVAFEWDGRRDAVGDCFLCGKEGKLSISPETG